MAIFLQILLPITGVLESINYSFTRNDCNHNLYVWNHVRDELSWFYNYYAIFHAIDFDIKGGCLNTAYIKSHKWSFLDVVTYYLKAYSF